MERGYACVKYSVRERKGAKWRIAGERVGVQRRATQSDTEDVHLSPRPKREAICTCNAGSFNPQRGTREGKHDELLLCSCLLRCAAVLPCD